MPSGNRGDVSVKLPIFLGMALCAMPIIAVADEVEPHRKVPPSDYASQVYTDARGCTFVLRSIEGWDIWVQLEPSDEDCRQAASGEAPDIAL